MSKTINTLLAIIIVGMFPAMVIYQYYNTGEAPGVNVPTGDQGADEALEIALSLLENAPTYSFDGIEGSMEVIELNIAESWPVQYFITIKFDCRQAGYGDRTGMVLAQVITTHEASLRVVEGKVTSAILDGEWDEINQEMK